MLFANLNYFDEYNHYYYKNNCFWYSKFAHSPSEMSHFRNGGATLLANTPEYSNVRSILEKCGSYANFSYGT